MHTPTSETTMEQFQDLHPVASWGSRLDAPQQEYCNDPRPLDNPAMIADSREEDARDILRPLSLLDSSAASYEAFQFGTSFFLDDNNISGVASSLDHLCAPRFGSDAECETLGGKVPLDCEHKDPLGALSELGEIPHWNSGIDIDRVTERRVSVSWQELEEGHQSSSEDVFSPSSDFSGELPGSVFRKFDDPVMGTPYARAHRGETGATLPFENSLNNVNLFPEVGDPEVDWAGTEFLSPHASIVSSFHTAHSLESLQPLNPSSPCYPTPPPESSEQQQPISVKEGDASAQCRKFELECLLDRLEARRSGTSFVSYRWQVPTDLKQAEITDQRGQYGTTPSEAAGQAQTLCSAERNATTSVLQSTPPANERKPPAKKRKPPANQSGAPAKRNAAHGKRSASPKRGISKRSTPPPKRKAAPAKRPAAPSKRAAGPAKPSASKKAASPPAKQDAASPSESPTQVPNDRPYMVRMDEQMMVIPFQAMNNKQVLKTVPLKRLSPDLRKIVANEKKKRPRRRAKRMADQTDSSNARSLTPLGPLRAAA